LNALRRLVDRWRHPGEYRYQREYRRWLEWLAANNLTLDDGSARLREAMAATDQRAQERAAFEREFHATLWGGDNRGGTPRP
jgi:uncharacterized protein YukE